MNWKWVKKYIREVVLGVLILANLCVWTAVYVRRPGGTLSVYFLDVGQGDAIFIDSPSHGRVLIDGGPDRKVLSEVGKILPFTDKRIDVVMETHPDRDHIGGLPEIISRYDVGAFIEPGVESENSIDDELERRIIEENIPSLIARRGMVINFGDGAELQILFPNQDVSKWETNDASIVGKLTYGESTFLLTGDSPLRVENILLKIDPVRLDADVLKAGHHGSRTSTSLAFANAVSPEYTIVSAGKDSSYSHPHKEVLDILTKIGSKVLNTASLGTITLRTNGQTLELK